MFQSFISIKDGVRSWWAPFLNSVVSRHMDKVAPEYYNESIISATTGHDSTYQRDLKGKTTNVPIKPELDLSDERIMDELIITNRLHKEMPRLRITKLLKIDTSFSYDDDDDDDDDSDNYSEMSIPPYKSCDQSEHSEFIDQPFKSIAITSPHFVGTDLCKVELGNHMSSESAETFNDPYGNLVYPSTTKVSFCSETGANSLPASPRQNAFHWVETNTQTPACSPMAGLSCKPVPVRLNYHLYRGMFCTAKAVVAPTAPPNLSWQS